MAILRERQSDAATIKRFTRRRHHQALHKTPPRVHAYNVSLIAVLKRLTFLLLVFGVALEPLGAQAGFRVGTTSQDVATAETMAEGMPCCPDEAPLRPACPKVCPLMAVCMTASIPATPESSTLGGRSILALAQLVPLDDQSRSGPVADPR
ncbi:hypothetical protein [Chenggangzhangella methanolivorans]|uniref:Uncharacterized protein n=1 Tax=Chenggangzhangella methanolivorans TaxID=1437009 RepID=A0A9E6RAM9_9HYPH|nr:hypothetical protein [Chenggangzhangella methanolivorans]QZO00345.1 hypothetical protein K6K41_00705 [Chenggangzhangella methanolivorans]